LLAQLLPAPRPCPHDLDQLGAHIDALGGSEIATLQVLGDNVVVDGAWIGELLKERLGVRLDAGVVAVPAAVPRPL
jgi:hypothetical protein